jgi:glycosyltransferase involved in cell wall biosynthesis
MLAKIKRLLRVNIYSQAVKNHKVILVDGFFLCKTQRGMANYLQGLLEGTSQKVVVLTREKISLGSNVQQVKLPRVPYVLWEQLMLPLMCIFWKADFLISPNNTAPLWVPKFCKQVIIVHDLIFYSWAHITMGTTLRQKFGQLYRRLLLPFVIYNCDKVITVSYETRQSLKSRFKKKEINLSIVYNTINEEIISAQNIKAQCPTQESDFILCVSGVSQNKNLQVIFNAMHLRGGNEKVVVTGVKESELSKMVAEVKKQNLHDTIVFLPWVSAPELIQLYKNCSVFIMPSIDEGFGIPVIEALYFNSKVICSDIPIFLEIAGKNAIYFNPNDAVDLSSKIDIAKDNADSFTKAYVQKKIY